MQRVTFPHFHPSVNLREDSQEDADSKLSQPLWALVAPRARAALLTSLWSVGACPFCCASRFPLRSALEECLPSWRLLTDGGYGLTDGGYGPTDGGYGPTDGTAVTGHSSRLVKMAHRVNGSGNRSGGPQKAGGGDSGARVMSRRAPRRHTGARRGVSVAVAITSALAVAMVMEVRTGMPMGMPMEMGTGRCVRLGMRMPMRWRWRRK